MYHGFAAVNGNSTSRVQFPEFPCEEPTAKEVSEFFELAAPLLQATYAADFSAETPAHLMHLLERNE